jgi:PKD repeat protein
MKGRIFFMTLLVVVLAIGFLMPYTVAQEEVDPVAAELAANEVDRQNPPFRADEPGPLSRQGGTPDAILYFWDFEGTDGGFAGTLDWEWGTYAWAGTCATYYEPPAAYSGTDMWGTVLNECYNNLGNNSGFDTCINDNPADDSILSFTIDLTGVTEPVEMSWWEWYDLYMNWDWGEVYANGNVIFQHCGTGYIIPTAWEEQVADLTPYIGGLVDIEFHMMASAVVERAGWWIDDLMIYTVSSPEIVIDAPPLEAELCPDATETLTFTICNTGNAPLVWEIEEMSPTLQLASMPSSGGNSLGQPASAPTRAVAAPRVTSEADCAAYENYAGAEPLGYAEFCGGAVPSPAVGGPAPAAPTDTGYAQDIGYISDNFVTFVLNDFPGQTVLGTTTNVYYGMDFDPTATTLYALNDTTGELGTIDLADGSFTGLVPCPAPVDIWTGLSIDPVTGVFYASDATDLYIIDPATGNYTLVGPFGTSLMIDIAMGPNGEMYGHDIGTDSIYWIDPATGAATLIGGPTGYNANYAQGLDFDNEDGTLYIFLYIGSGANVYGIVDLATGGVIPLAVDNPTGEFEGAIQTTALPPFDVPWLTEVPTNGVLAPDLCEVVEVTFDATGMMPGEYLADLVISSNDPVTPAVTLPVSLTVLVPPTIEFTPMELAAPTCPGGVEFLDLEICNLGECTLDWFAVEISETVELAGSAPFVPAGSATQGPIPKAPLTDSAPASAPVAVPAAPANPEAVLWDQPLSITNTGTYANQDFEAIFDGYDIFIADDFSNAGWWAVDTLFVVGNTWNAGCDLDCATTLNWHVYADAGGVPAGDPWGGGDPPVWAMSLPTDDPMVSLGTGTGGFQTNVTLTLDIPLYLPPDTYWLVFYPSLNYVDCACQSGRQVADTTNGNAAQVINPGGGFGFPTVWTSVQDPSTWGMVQQDLAFRMEGEVLPDVPWLSLDPAVGSLEAGECMMPEATLDSTGLLPGDYTADLLLVSNDPFAPVSTIPVTFTVWAPAEVVDVTYVITDLQVTFDATVSGDEPITFAWDFGDGNTSDLEDPTHTYDEDGCYAVVFTATNGCAAAVWSEEICVCTEVATMTLSMLTPYPIHMGDMVDFEADIVPDDFTPPFSYTIDYGDGMTEEGSTSDDPMAFSHAFVATGTMRVVVEIWNCGMEVPISDWMDVEVAEPMFYIYLPIVVKNN